MLDPGRLGRSDGIEVLRQALADHIGRNQEEGVDAGERRGETHHVGVVGLAHSDPGEPGELGRVARAGDQRAGKAARLQRCDDEAAEFTAGAADEEGLVREGHVQLRVLVSF